MKNKLIKMGRILVILLVTAFMLLQCKTVTPKIENLESGFMNPPTENRPLAFWDWLNGYVDTTKMVYELNQMKDKGMQGAFIWDVGALSDPEKLIPAGPAFLGPKSLATISLALKTSGRLGLNLGMITSSSWNAGGDWIGEDDAIKELLSSNQIITGPAKLSVSINEPKSRRGVPVVYSLITTIAIRYSESKNIDYVSEKTISLDKFVSKDNRITWDVPEGKWDIISFFMCNTGQHLACPSPNSNGLMIDHLSRDATRIHFDTILKRLDRISTADNHLKYLEVDSYEVRPAKDWTPGFVQEFKTRYGYDPVPYLPLLQGYTSNDSLISKRFRGDYNRLISDLMIENHFKQATEMVHEKGIRLFAEAGHGGFPRVDPLKAFGYTDVPMGEFWNRQRHWVTKEAASAAHIYGKKIVASESLTSWQQWQQGPTDYKQLCDIAFCEGLNQVFFHTFAHNPEIAGKPGFTYHAGEHINVNTTWWEMAKPFMDYLSRCSYLLRQGNVVADVLLYYGADAPNLVPPKRIDPNYTPDMPGIFPKWFYDNSKCPHCGLPKPINPGQFPGYDYDYINADIITTTLRAENGKLVLPHGQSYRVMMLPDRKDISLEVLRSLEKLVDGGAVILGPKPERTTSLKDYPGCDTEVKILADKIWGKCDGKTIFSNKSGKGMVYWGKSLEQVLKELNIQPDFDVKGVDNCDQHIDYIHRQTETEEIYFVSNSSPKEEKITCVFRVNENKVPEIWDAETGLIQREIDYSKGVNGISIDFILDPLASRLVVFRNQSEGKNDPGINYDLQYGFHKKHNAPHNNVSIDITDNWDVRFDSLMGGPKSFHLAKLSGWTDIDNEGIRYYSGKAIYNRSFSVKEASLSKTTEAYVVFQDIQEMARIYVNDQDCGIVWTPPYKANITPYLKAGKNSITVEVINTWNNRIVGDVKNPDGKQYTRTNIKYKFKGAKSLLKSGLMGKAEIFLTN
jgi:hypothetical protein